MDERRLAELAANLAGGEQLAESALQTLVDLRQLAGESGAAVGDPDRDDVGVDLARRDDADLDSHRIAMVSDPLSTGWRRHPER